MVPEALVFPTILLVRLALWVPVVPVVLVALWVPEDLVVRAALVVLWVPEDLVVQPDSESYSLLPIREFAKRSRRPRPPALAVRLLSAGDIRWPGRWR